MALFFGSFGTLANKLHISQCTLTQYTRADYRHIPPAAARKVIHDLYEHIKKTGGSPTISERQYKAVLAGQPPVTTIGTRGVGIIIRLMGKVGVVPMVRKSSQSNERLHQFMKAFMARPGVVSFRKLLNLFPDLASLRVALDEYEAGVYSNGST